MTNPEPDHVESYDYESRSSHCVFNRQTIQTTMEYEYSGLVFRHSHLSIVMASLQFFR